MSITQKQAAYVMIDIVAHAGAGADIPKMVFTASASKGGVAMIRITDVIAGDTPSSAVKINQQVDKLILQGIQTAQVYINSGGGSTFEATEIANELDKFPVKPKIKVGAMAASAATYLCAKFHTTAKRNSRFMIHKPSVAIRGNETALESAQKLLKNITDEYRTAYATKTGKSEEEIEKLWANGDVWMTAQEAKEFGLVDEIEDSDEQITKETVASFTACGCPTSHVPAITSNTMNREELIALLGLPADATDEQIKEAMQQMKQKADKAEETEETEETEAQKKATALVAAAITAKKITADKKAKYETLALADYGTTKALLDEMPAVKPLSKQTTPGAVIDGDGIPAARKSWTVDDWLDKDPEAFAKLEETNPDDFKTLNEQYFKSK